MPGVYLKAVADGWIKSAVLMYTLALQPSHVVNGASLIHPTNYD